MKDEWSVLRCPCCDKPLFFMKEVKNNIYKVKELGLLSKEQKDFSKRKVKK